MSGGDDRLEGHLQLSDNHVGAGEERLRGDDIGRQQTVIGARRHDDQVFAALFDDDQCHAGRLCHPSNVAHVDAVGPQGRQQFPAVPVVANAAKHAHLGADTAAATA